MTREPDPFSRTTDLLIDPLIAQVRAAAASGTPLRIRGGGTKDFYGQTLQGEILDTRLLSGVVSYEPSELVITVLAGTPLAQVEALLADHGQCLPFEPPHFSIGIADSLLAGQSNKTVGAATVGGAVASGLAGPARASVGGVRDYMLGVRLINGKAEHLTFGGQVMKNVAGYDVSRLMAGALGTLGLLTELSLKVLPVAPSEATLRFECSQPKALQWLNAWGGQPLPLNASCWLEEGGVGTLYLRLRGAVAAVDAACKTLGGEKKNNADVAADWQALRNQTLPWFSERTTEQDLWRLSVPQTAPGSSSTGAPLVEWHGAQRWVRANAEQAQTLRDQAAEVGGHATLFIASGLQESRATARFDTLKPPLDRIHRQLKHEFDPDGIFNPGRLSADW